eukprot:2621807-Prymnesium_polylepis.1
MTGAAAGSVKTARPISKLDKIEAVDTVLHCTYLLEMRSTSCVETPRSRLEITDLRRTLAILRRERLEMPPPYILSTRTFKTRPTSRDAFIHSTRDGLSQLEMGGPVP